MTSASQPRRRRTHAVVTILSAFVVGTLVGASVYFVASSVAPSPSTPEPGTVVLDNVQVDYFYLNGTSQVFGTNQQSLCPLCPLTLTGGTTFTIGKILSQTIPPNSTIELWFNATSPVPFEEWECSYSGARPADWPPTGCPFTTDWHQPPSIYESGAGGSLGLGYPLVLSIPDPAPSLPGGFEVQLVFVVATVPALPT